MIMNEMRCAPVVSGDTPRKPSALSQRRRNHEKNIVDGSSMKAKVKREEPRTAMVSLPGTALHGVTPVDLSRVPEVHDTTCVMAATLSQRGQHFLYSSMDTPNMPRLAKRAAVHIRRSRKRHTMMDAMTAVAAMSTRRADMATKKIPSFIMIAFFCVFPCVFRCVRLRYRSTRGWGSGQPDWVK